MRATDIESRLVTKPPITTRVRNKLALWQSQSERKGSATGEGGEAYKYLFIITFGRTGSTLLQKLLCNIPGYYIAGENLDAIYGIYYSYKQSRLVKEKQGYAPLGNDHPWHGGHAIDPDAYGRALISAFVAHVINPPRSAETIGFKEISYLSHLDELGELLDFMMAFFTGSRFIVNSRSASATGKSGWWADADQEKLASNIAAFDQICLRYCTAAPERFFKVQYEDWTTNVHALQPVYQWLGESFDANAVQSILDVRLTHLQPKA
jgi:Sulfotransferase family